MSAFISQLLNFLHIRTSPGLRSRLLCFLEEHRVLLRLKIIVFGLGATLFDIGSDFYNGLLYMWPKNVTRTVPDGLSVPSDCDPTIGAINNVTYTCLEVDLYWGVGSIALLQLPAVSTTIALLLLLLLDKEMPKKINVLASIAVFAVVPFPLTIVGVQLFFLARPDYDGLIGWKAVSNSVLLLETFGEAAAQAALQVRLRNILDRYYRVTNMLCISRAT